MVISKSDFVTFDQYADDIRKNYKRQIAAWDSERKAVELVRKHGGSEFTDFDWCSGEQPEPRPSGLDIPKSPDIESVAPYSRIKLLREERVHGTARYCPSLMIVFDVADDEIEGYIYGGYYRTTGRVSVDKHQIIECMPPLVPGEEDDANQDDDIPF